MKSGAVNATPSELIYPPSGRKIVSFAIFLLLWSCISFRYSLTDDEVVHRLSIAGAAFFALGAGYVLAQFMRGAPKLVLRPEGFVWDTGLEAHFRSWSEYEGFCVGHVFGPIETISFIRSDTGATGALLNTTNVGASVLCEEFSRWRNRYAVHGKGRHSP
jgi:hypothetical protein